MHVSAIAELGVVQMLESAIAELDLVQMLTCQRAPESKEISHHERGRAY
jgi:hypothetical protein